MFVGAESEFGTREGGHEQKQGGVRQVKVGEETVNPLEFVGRVDVGGRRAIRKIVSAINICIRSAKIIYISISINMTINSAISISTSNNYLTASDDGTLWCVWLDLRDRGTKLFVSKSIDQGATWTKNVLAYRSPSGSICECCHPSILAQGSWVHILFRNSLKGDRDMYLALLS